MKAILPTSWTYREVLAHIHQHHPRCPGEHAHRIVGRVLGRPRWRGRPLGEAVGVEMQNYLRHELTNYDELLAVRGADREAARAAVKGKVRRKLAKWDRPRASPMEPPDAPGPPEQIRTS